MIQVNATDRPQDNWPARRWGKDLRQIFRWKAGLGIDLAGILAGRGDKMLRSMRRADELGLPEAPVIGQVHHQEHCTKQKYEPPQLHNYASRRAGRRRPKRRRVTMHLNWFKKIN